MLTHREPHIGECDTKTNAICASPANSDRVPIKPRTGPADAISGASGPSRRRVLLPVAFQHLIAGRADFGTILLKASQNGEIALIDHCTAVALNVARTGGLLLRRTAALLLLLLGGADGDG